MTDRIWIFMLFALGLLVAGIQVYVFQAPWDFLHSDALNYINRAEAIATGIPLSDIHTVFPLGLSYLYAVPLMILDTENALYVIGNLQILAIALCPVLVHLTGGQLDFSVRVTRLAGLLTVTCWPVIAQASFYMAEPFFMFLLLSGQYLLLRSLKSPSMSLAVAAGALIGFAAIIKTQGYIILIAALLVALFTSRARSLLLPFIACITVSVVHGLHVGEIRNDGGFGSPSNGAFNMYLGQSARSGLGGTDTETGTFLYFNNNNSKFNKDLLPPRLVPVSMLNSRYFIEQTLNLWQSDPVRQLIRSTQSAFELHSISAQWPVRMIPLFSEIERGYKSIALVAIYLPAILVMVVSLRTGVMRTQVCYLWLTLAGITAVAAISMGQPRYLVPFFPNLLLLASLGWSSLIPLLRMQPATASVLDG